MIKTVVIIIVILLLLLFSYLLLKTRIPGIVFFFQNLNGSAVFLILTAVALVIFLLIKVLFSQSTQGSFFNKKNELPGEEETAQQIEIAETEGNEAGFTMADALYGNEAGDDTVYITVSGETYLIGSAAFADAASLKDAIVCIKDQARNVCLVDDYALSEAYREAESMLTELLVSFERTRR